MRLFARFALCQFTLLAIVLATATASQAQGPGGDREGRGDRGDREGRERRWGGGPRNPADFWKRLDTNGNGILEPSEIPEQMRPFIQKAAARAGLDPNQPLPIDKLVQAAQQSDGMGPPRSGNSPGPGGPAPGGPGSGTAPSGGPSAGGPHKPEDKPAGEKEAPGKAGAAKAASGPTLPGFGTKADVAAVPGFGGTTTPASVSAAGSLASTGSSGPTGKPAEGSSTSDDQAKLRHYAESFIKQYDTNKSGALEKDEWSAMKSDYQAADTNGDGVITVDEMMAYLAGYGQRRGETYDAGSSSSTASSDSGPRGSKKSSSASGSKPRRFLTATERLPDGLPSWFARSDLDGDGQVSMWEFSSVWTEAKAAEFAKYDLNGDGVITPQEVLQVERGKGKPDSRADTSRDSRPDPAKDPRPDPPKDADKEASK